MRSYGVFFLSSASALIAAAALPQNAMAEEDDADANQIVVTGARPIAESEAAALQVQKNADSLVTVAASDSVGRLPDQNIAQATGGSVRPTRHLLAAPDAPQVPSIAA